MTEFDRDEILAFVQRDWAAVRSAKERYWAESAAARGFEDGLRASGALWLHVRAIDPEWPTAESRAEDFAHHEHLKRLIDAARDGFSGR
ncbi:MAG: hypothetical protein AAGA20_01455 [Planctomycetota bacterium]